MELNFNYSRLDWRKFFFSNRCIDVWKNKLTENEISITFLNSFKIAKVKLILGVIVEGTPLMSKI